MLLSGVSITSLNVSVAASRRFGTSDSAHNIPALAACVITFTLGEMTAIPVAAAYVADLAPSHMRGRYMGVYGLMWSVAMIAGPALGMRLFAIGHGMLWLCCGGLTTLAALAVLAPVRAPVVTSVAADAKGV